MKYFRGGPIAVRRENLEFLAETYGTQSALAKALASKTISQPIISSILQRKRPLPEREARDIEEMLDIPIGWIDRYSLRKSWGLIRPFSTLDTSTQEILNALLKFAEEHAPCGASLGKRPETLAAAIPSASSSIKACISSGSRSRYRTLLPNAGKC